MIRLYRLSSGEDVIGTPQESDKANHVALKKPFVLIPMQVQNLHLMILLVVTLLQFKQPIYLNH